MLVLLARNPELDERTETPTSGEVARLLRRRSVRARAIDLDELYSPDAPDPVDLLARAHHAAESVRSIGADTVLADLPPVAEPLEGMLAYVMRGAPDEPVIAIRTGPRAETSATDLADRIARGAADRPVPGWLPQPPRIESPRLVLTWPTRPQVDDYYELIRNSRMFDTLTWDGPASAADMNDFYFKSTQRHVVTRPPHRWTSLAVIDKATGLQIGGISYRPKPASSPPNADIGYALAEPYQGRGLGTEAVGVLIDEAFTAWGAFRIEAEVFVGNTVSKRLLQKLGFIHEGTNRQRTLKHGQNKDEWLFAITRDLWENQRARAPLTR